MSRSTILIEREKGVCHLSGPRRDIRMERVFCAAEWIDRRGITQRMESLGMRAVSRTVKNKITVVRFELPQCPTLSWSITDEGGSILFRQALTNTTRSAIRVKTLLPFVIDFERGGQFQIQGKLNQAWTACQKRGFGATNNVYIFAELYNHSRFLADGMCCLHRRQSSAVTAGFVSAREMFGQFTLDFDPSTRNPQRFQAFCDAEGAALRPGETLNSEALLVDLIHPARGGMERYAKRLGREMKARHVFQPPVGWSTWDYFFGQIDERIILDNVRFLREHRSEYPVEYIQIDAGYSSGHFNWTDWNERFPHGPKWLVDQIKSHGFKAGLWLIPFYAHEKSRVAQDHPDWLVKDEQGRPACSLEGSFVLDGTHPQAQAWMTKLACTITCAWGFEYIKIDGASMIGMIKGIHFNPRATGCQAYRQGIEAFRRGMADRTLFMGGIFPPSIGVVDAMRIGEDVGARWDWSHVDVHHGERDRYHGSGNVKRSISASLNNWYMNGHFWINDGDYLVVRDDRSELTLDEARTWATVIGLYGGSVILGDNMPSLKPERAEVLSRIFPVYRGAARPIDVLEREIPSLLALDVNRRFERWLVVAVFNYDDQPTARTIDFEALGLSDAEDYHVHGFWGRTYHGQFRRRMALVLKPHACEVLAIRSATGAPQVVGTDIHITQGGVELQRAHWDARGRLTLALKAPGVKKGRVMLHVPSNWKLKSMTPDGEKCRVENHTADLICLAVQFDKRLDMNLSFVRRKVRQRVMSMTRI